MPTREEINTKYLILHKNLGKQKDAVDKEKFNETHRKLWKDYAAELIARLGELEKLPSLSLQELKETQEIRAYLHKEVS